MSDAEVPDFKASRARTDDFAADLHDESLALPRNARNCRDPRKSTGMGRFSRARRRTVTQPVIVIGRSGVFRTRPSVRFSVASIAHSRGGIACPRSGSELAVPTYSGMRTGCADVTRPTVSPVRVAGPTPARLANRDDGAGEPARPWLAWRAREDSV